jgi:hypothetical protein
MQSSKPWSVAASLRGFYDDNYATSPDDEQESFGFRVQPSASINLPLERTLLTASYIYTLNWFEAREKDNLDSFDQAHQFDLAVSHSFSERYMLQLRDSFVVAQEPELLEGGSPFRTQGDNIRNSAFAGFNIEMSRLWSVNLSYRNTYINYDDEDPLFVVAPQPVIASRSGLLDRVDHYGSVDLRRVLTPTTVGFLGYGFGTVCYTGDEEIAFDPTVGFIMSDARNNISHRGYVGVDHAFSPSLNGSMSGGVQYTDYYNDPSDSGDSLSPYAQARIAYSYTAGGNAYFSFLHARSATDVVAPDGNGGITMDQQSSTISAGVSHPITPRIRGDASGFTQFATFNGGAADGENETFYGAELNLSYSFNPHLSADAGYRFSGVCSDEPFRNYDRNIFYVGVTAIY